MTILSSASDTVQLSIALMILCIISQILLLNWTLSSQGFVMALKRRRATSPSSSVSGGDFDDSQASSLVPSFGRKRRRTSNIPTVDPVILQISVTIS